MRKIVGLWASSIVSLGMVGGAGAQTVEGAPPADAAAFGAAGSFAIAIDRAFGFDYLWVEELNQGAEALTTSATGLSLFGSPATGAPSAFTFPRAGFDFFIEPDFSLGLGLGVVYASTTIKGGGETLDQSFKGLVAAPRVGYAWRLRPGATLWPRAGISVVYVKETDTSTGFFNEMPTHLFAVTVEVPVVLTLAPRVAFTLGPTLDITFNGHTIPHLTDAGQPSLEERVVEVGVQAGLLVHL